MLNDIKKWIGIVAVLLAGFCVSCSDPSGTDDITASLIRKAVDDRFAEAIAYKANVPGVLVGVWDDSRGISLVYARGVADRDTMEALTGQHSFKIASVTKTMVTTLICQLVDEGKLSFDSPLSTWFPDLRDAGAVTVRMLGDMTSGYFDYLEDETFLYNFDNVPYFTAAPQELVDVGLSHDPEYEPGTGFNYSNTNTVLLGLIIEKITGNSLETELRNRLFLPLGFEKTGAPSSGAYLPEPKARSYHPDTGEDWTDKMDYSPEYACGNAYSVLSELAVWAEALATGSLISGKAHAERLSRGTLMPGTSFHIYHFGMIDYKGFLGHSGNTDYYLTEAYHNPESGTTVIVLSNSSVAGFTGVVFEDIVSILLP